MGQPERFSQRWRSFQNKAYDDWYYIVVGGPVAALLCTFVADVRWITPNRITLLGFVFRVAALPLILVGRLGEDRLAAVLLLVAGILDVMDGSLARHRKQASALGAFLDKSTDALSILSLGGVLGYRLLVETGQLLYAYAAAFIAVSYVTRCYFYWVVRYTQWERGRLPKDSTAPPGQLEGAKLFSYYLKALPRLAIVGEGDVYMWLALGLLCGYVAQTTVLVAIFMAPVFVYYAVKRTLAMYEMDGASST